MKNINMEQGEKTTKPKTIRLSDEFLNLLLINFEATHIESEFEFGSQIKQAYNLIFVLTLASTGTIPCKKEASSM